MVNVVKRIEQYVEPYRVVDGRKFRLKDIDPGDTAGLKSNGQAKEWLAKGVEWLADLQEKLYADAHGALLLIFQAMDAAGKDGAIKHVMSGVNHRAARFSLSRRPPPWSWTTTSCGGR
jgi:polyphosphate kinase 2 (PPK2 family)